ncbi:MAG: 3-oxoacyl-[acyl-carrier-protein] reductase [Candidatus Omnitrophica bacterium]|nr:3-oxoacyl-[acyl-carrier-protein] reductase [Candidatus Omnitrophota bacterium]
MVNSKHLTGRTAIVTGATRGIGRAIALKLAQEGSNIAFNYLSNKKLADSLVDEIKNYGVKVLAFKVDVRDFDKVQKMKDKILDKLGALDILINNAGITKDVPLAMMSPDNWDSVIDSNLKGTFNVTRSFIFTFIKQKFGNIINISSLSGIMGIAGQANYSASKGGIISFTKSLAKEVASYNIRVNAIAPGFIETDMVSNLDQKKILDLIPLNRLGKPEEVAEVVNFLLKKDSAYITGQVIRIDGGLGM